MKFLSVKLCAIAEQELCVKQSKCTYQKFSNANEIERNVAAQSNPRAQNTDDQLWPKYTFH